MKKIIGFSWFHKFFCLDFFQFSGPLCISDPLLILLKKIIFPPTINVFVEKDFFLFSYFFLNFVRLKKNIMCSRNFSRQKIKMMALHLWYCNIFQIFLNCRYTYTYIIITIRHIFLYLKNEIHLIWLFKKEKVW